MPFQERIFENDRQKSKNKSDSDAVSFGAAWVLMTLVGLGASLVPAAMRRGRI